jgi:aspartate aminotransferase
MTAYSTSRRITRLQALVEPVLRYVSQSAYARKSGQPGVSDFAFGNPHDMPIPEFAQALGRASLPQNKDWFAYKRNEPQAQEVAAASLRESRGMPFAPEDIFLTNGSFAALGVTLNAIVDPGDEVIFISPPWFFYEIYIAASGALPVRVRIDPQTFDLDLEAIRSAITPRTRAIIVNSPNNPTGKIYPPRTLEALAGLLGEASQKNGRALYLISDEAYWRIRFDGRAYPSPAAFYPNSFLLYTYGKTLLAPGQRIGYIALPPAMPGREELREALFTAQLLSGWAFPNALLQHALADIDSLSIDIPRLQKKRDWMVSELRRMGYELHSPEGTFYLLPRSPVPDDWAFTELLAEHDILCLPGAVVEMPGYFRISLTANEQMIERALPGFEKAIRQA